MLKSTAVAAVAGLSLFVFAAPFVSAASLPLLSGSYLYTSSKFCQMPVTVRYGATPPSKGAEFVTQVISGNGPNTVELGGGSLSFVQSGGAGKGMATINGFEADGSPILLTETGGGVTLKTGGAPLESSPNTGSAPFTQTATAVTFKTGDGTDNFHIYYGKVRLGIVQNAVIVGIDPTGCVEQYALTHG